MTMSNEHALAEAAGEAFFERAERRLEALFTEHRVSDPSELTPEKAGEIFTRAITEAAADFPSANLAALARGTRSFAHPAFLLALERVSIAMTFRSDPLAPAAGVHAAVVLAGFGLPVAPFDLVKGSILEEPSNDIDTVVSQFARWKAAYVGYNTCDAPFYVLYTDCLRTLINRVPVHTNLKQVKQLFERPGRQRPSARPRPQLRLRHGDLRPPARRYDFDDVFVGLEPLCGVHRLQCRVADRRQGIRRAQ
jgi:hypothetical protein